MTKLKIMHATAENMIYIRTRLDGLINKPAPPPLPPPPPEKVIEVEVVKVPVLPEEIPVVLTIVNAKHIDARLSAIEQQLTEALLILRRLL